MSCSHRLVKVNLKRPSKHLLQAFPKIFAKRFFQFLVKSSKPRWNVLKNFQRHSEKHAPRNSLGIPQIFSRAVLEALPETFFTAFKKVFLKALPKTFLELFIVTFHDKLPKAFFEAFPKTFSKIFIVSCFSVLNAVFYIYWDTIERLIRF